MNEWLKENKMYLFIAVLAVITVGIYIFVPAEKEQSGQAVNQEWLEINAENPLESQGDAEQEETNEEKEKILIDVKGAVAIPGVYEASLGDRVQDLINQAGGLLETADQKSVNFAQKVADEMVLYIPMIGEEGQLESVIQAGVPNGAALGGKTLINLNKASAAELETLPGVGPAKAAAIIEYRESNGGYRSIEDLMEISGIGAKTFEKLKEHITVH